MSANRDPSTRDAELAGSLAELLDRLPVGLRTEASVDSEVWDTALLDPARDILTRSGKGFRARLLAHAWRLAGGDPARLPELLLVVIEVLHVGSLVIDDIEDDSQLRRGRPALHRQYGLPLALNTGNWLYFVAMALVARLDLDPKLRLALYEDVSVALVRCHHGQALDLSLQVTAARRVDLPELVRSTTRLKTGSLMSLASVMGARAAGAPDEAVRDIGRFGSDLGIGLQMLDDWSGVRVEARREKGREDLRHARPTWPWAWLAEVADEVTYAQTVKAARDLATDWEADRLLERIHGHLAEHAPAAIRAQLDRARADLGRSLGDAPGLAELDAEIAALECAYG